MNMHMTNLINSKISRQLLMLAVAALITTAAFAQELESASIDVFRLFMGLFGGLALFLFGIDQMSHGLKAVAGDRMASMLGSVTKNRFLGAITGAFVTAMSMKHSGAMLFGLGLLFGGMGVMSDAMYPLRSYPPFLELMGQLENPLLGILVGAIFTGLVQSSAATTGIAIVMASEGLMSLPAGIALALGANIGTCVTAILAALGKPVAARQAAAAHIVFNILGVLIWLPFIDLLAQLSATISPSHPELDGAARMAKEVPRQIANAHTIFNVANTVLFIWFTGALAKFVQRLMPDRKEVELEIIKPKFLSDSLLLTPTLALDAARMEGQRLGSIAFTMLEKLKPALQSRDMKQLAELEKMDDQVDVLKEHILEYLGEIHKQELTEKKFTSRN